MTRTDKYNLKKPGLDDLYDVGDFNDNADSIDAALSEHDTQLSALSRLGTVFDFVLTPPLPIESVDETNVWLEPVGEPATVCITPLSHSGTGVITENTALIPQWSAGGNTSALIRELEQAAWNTISLAETLSDGRIKLTFDGDLPERTVYFKGVVIA